MGYGEMPCNTYFIAKKAAMIDRDGFFGLFFCVRLRGVRNLSAPSIPCLPTRQALKGDNKVNASYFLIFFPVVQHMLNLIQHL